MSKLPSYRQPSACQGRSNCAACSLREDMVCADVPLDDVVGFHTQAVDYRFPPGTIMQNTHGPVEAVYCVRQGAVKLVKYDANGGQRIVRVMKRGDVVGIDWAFSGSAESTAVAIGEVHACRIPVDFFRQFTARHADLQIRLLRKSQEALREVELWLAQLVGGAIPARVRVARLLLRLRDGDGERIHRLSNEDLGAILGLTEETISRVIAGFLREGMLERAGSSLAARYLRADIAALERVAGQD